LLAQAAVSQEVEECHFAWNVAHELAVLKKAPQSVTAGGKPGTDSPILGLDQPYQLKLVPQSTVTYVVKPAKPTLSDSMHGGLVRFGVDKAGLYRVSITSGHWVDVVDGTNLLKSRDFTGSRSCDRVHKILEFDLPAGRELALQLSGATEAHVLIAITPVTGAPSR
jgi:hypothetical protein